MIEKWNKSVDNKGNFGALLTDLPKAFDCIGHELLIPELSPFVFDFKSLKFIIVTLIIGNKELEQIKVSVN